LCHLGGYNRSGCGRGYSHVRRNWRGHGFKAVGTLASTAGVDVCVICACEEDCNDCDGIEAPELADLVILFKALPLHKCMHKDVDFP